MAKKNFRRIYRVAFGKPPDSVIIDDNRGIGFNVSKVQSPRGKSFDGTTIPLNAFSMSNVEGEEDYIGYQFKFSLESTRKMSKTGSGNEKTTLRLYNIEDDEVEKLNQNGAVVRVYAGYEDTGLSLAYSGDIIRVVPAYEGEDTVYKITCKDGANDNKNARISIDYSDQMSDADIIKDLIIRYPTADLAVAAVAEARNTYEPYGHSFQGFLENNLNWFMEKFRLIYGWFNGKISIVPDSISQSSEDFSVIKNNGYVLEADQIKDIAYCSKSSNVTTNSKELTRDIIVNTFYLPLDFATMITIPYDKDNKIISQYMGSYVIVGNKTHLESYGKRWDVSIKAKAVG